MIKIDFYPPDKIPDGKYKFAVIMARQGGQWLFVRHRERRTWEISGGHREAGETVGETPARELWEETGSKAQVIVPVSGYSVDDGTQKSYGMLYYAEVNGFGVLPEFEIEEVVCRDGLPENLTYPQIQPALYEQGLKFFAAWQYTMNELQ